MTSMFNIKKPKRIEAEDRLEKLDEVADKAGFPSREAVVPRRRKNYTGPTVSFNTKLTQPEMDRFVDYCNERGFTYRQAITRLLDVSDKHDKRVEDH